MKHTFLATGSKIALVCLALIIAAAPLIVVAQPLPLADHGGPSSDAALAETPTPLKPTAPLTPTMGISQTLSGEAQRNLRAFEGSITNTDFLFLPISVTLQYPEMALIPGGEFVMGDHHNYVDPAHPSDEVPTHTVQLAAFYAGKYEVTNQQYADYLNSALAQGLIEVRSGIVFTTTRSGLVYGQGANNLYFETNLAVDYSQIGWNGSTFSVLNNRGNHPVVGVRWYGAAAYTNWLSAQKGYASCYNLATGACDFTQNGYRLPTEAEWEYAGRGGQYTPYTIFPWGDTADTTKANWPNSGDPYETGSYPWTTPVGFYNGQLRLKADFGWPGSQTSYQTSNGANGYGLYDVAGNVWEFVHDWYGQGYYSVSPIDNPTGPLTGTIMLDGLAYRGMRGGNWYNGENGHARVANRDPSYYRGPLDPYQPYYNVGFRVARPVTVTPSVTQTVGLFINDARSWEGYTLFAPKHYTTTYLINNQGLQVHSWSGTLYEPGQSAYLLENGHLLRAAMTKGPLSTGGGEGGRIEEYDWDGNLAWEFNYSTNLYMSHHDLRALPNGNVIVLAVEKKTYTETLAAGFNPSKFQPEIQQQGYMLPDYVIEVSPTYPSGGQIVWMWRVWDHLIQDYDATKANYGVVADHPELIDADGTGTQIPAFWNHMNSIDYNPQLDQILLSVRGNSEIWIIDHSATITEAAGHTGGARGKGGDLLYRWGNPLTYKAGTVSAQKFYQQHDAEWIVPGNPGAGNITVFNNGLGRNYSTVDEITPPVDVNGNYTRTAGAAYGPLNFTWSYSATPPSSMYAGAISGAQRLPNGNTLIDDGTHGTFTEVTPGKEIVWKYINPVVLGRPLTQGDAIPTDPARSDELMNAVFRVYRYAPTYPGLIGRDLTPGQPIELYTTPVTTFALAAHSAGNGAGVVTNTPGGTVFLAGTVVTLTATPNPGSVFVGWSGAVVATTNPLVLTMAANKVVTATFNLLPTATYTLTVNKTGTGNGAAIATYGTGTMFQFPAQITNLLPGTVITLTAVPTATSAFAGWSGDVVTMTNSLVLTMTASRQVTATFTLNPPRNSLYLPLVVR